MAVVAYNTGGVVAGALSTPGQASYAIYSSVVGGAVGATVGPIVQTGDPFNISTRGFLAGVAGGAASGVTGQHFFHDMYLPPTVGGVVGGAINGDAGTGMVMGMANGMATVGAYGVYEYFLTLNKEVPDEMSCHEFTNLIVSEGDPYLEWHGDEVVMNEGKIVMLEEDIYIEGTDKLLAEKGPMINENALAHSGKQLGRTMSGQIVVLSKLGPKLPVKVTTGQYLNSYYHGFIPATATTPRVYLRRPEFKLKY